MSRQEEFDRIVTAIHEAALDEGLWPAASTLIDRACGIRGNHLVTIDDFAADAEIVFGRLLYHGEHAETLERDYVEDHFPRDPRIPRLMRLPDARVTHMRALYTEPELRTDPTFNEMLRATEARNGLNIRMGGPDGLDIAWVFADPVKPADWGSEQAEMLQSILPHVRQFVRVRHALVRAEAAGASLSGLHDTSMLGIVHLDWRGRILEANARAGEILRRGDGLTNRCGILRARRTADDTKLGRRLARALPSAGGQAFGSSMTVERTATPGRFSLHVCPLAGHRTSFGVGRVAALVLIVDPAASLRVDPGRTAAALGLTPAEGRVAAALAGGASVSDIVAATHRAESTVRWTIKRIHAKLGISRQADLVRMVLATAGVHGPRSQSPRT